MSEWHMYGAADPGDGTPNEGGALLSTNPKFVRIANMYVNLTHAMFAEVVQQEESDSWAVYLTMTDGTVYNIAEYGTQQEAIDKIETALSE